MERTPQGRAFDAPPIPEVGPEVRTIGIKDIGRAGLSTEEHQVLAKVVERSHPTGNYLVAEGHAEPAIG